MAGKGTGVHDVDALQAWLDPFLSNAYDISYPTTRDMKAMIVDVLRSDKYEKLMRAGKDLSSTWNFGVAALATAIGRIAKVLRGCFKMRLL